METKKELRERIERLENRIDNLQDEGIERRRAIIRLAHHFGIAETYTRRGHTPTYSLPYANVDVEWIMDDLQKIAPADTADKARARLTPHAPETEEAE